MTTDILPHTPANAPADAPVGAPATVPWLERLVKAVVAKAPGVSEPALTLWEGGTRVGISIQGSRVELDLRAADDSPCYDRTASFTITARRCDGGTLTVLENRVLSVLVRLIARADHGGLRVPVARAGLPEESTSGAMEPELDVPVQHSASVADVAAWQDAHAEEAERLNLFAYFAKRSILSEDLYPHSSALGDPLSEREILDAWDRTSSAILEGRAPSKLGLYLHIPYCTIECTFCYCGKTEHFKRSDIDLYTQRLLEEIDVFAPVLSRNTFTSVYFGGGTPSLLTPVAMRRLFTTLWDRFDVPEGTQVIFEANPDSLIPEKVAILGDLGRVTRLTIGIQTLDPVVQQYVRRHNKKSDVEAAVRAARKAGIKHVNFDCIAGLEGQTLESWQADLDYLLSLEPDSIHLNAFNPHPRTIFAKQGKALSEERLLLRDRMIAWGQARLDSGGHGSHEGQERHRTADAANLQEYDLRRQNSSLLGLGYPSRSHSFAGHYYFRDTSRGFVDDLRDQNASGDRRYLGLPVDLAQEERKYLVTNIRTGFLRSEFRELFGRDALAAAPEAFATLQRLGVAEVSERQVRFRCGNHGDALTYRGYFYDPHQLEQAMRRWGPEYDPSVDYRAQLALYASNAT